ncbi:MAG TPA: FtsX-like permease family protein [Verrucomicrobiales bacterium]|nr:FtsX-like permease family protein [Verrucomicrobiales bacterium]
MRTRLAVLEFTFRNLKQHKLRSFLTILGTILGVASVISMLAVGEGSKQSAIEQIRQLGAANVIIRSVKPEMLKEMEDTTSGATQQITSAVLEYGLKYRDLDLLSSTLPIVKNVVPLALVRRNAQQGRFRISNARILGTVPGYLKVKNLTIRRGRFLTQLDLNTTANTAVLSEGAARSLFSFEDPLGKTVLLGAGAYRIIGILDAQASGVDTPGAVGQQNLNNDIYIPITAAQRRFGELQLIVRAGSREYERTQLSEITLTVEDENLVSQTAAMVRKLLDRNHPNEDYEIQVPLELLRQAERQKRIWNLVLSSIAGISLLVGGVGIMNIMLATVTERTREIGIRRALGAKRRDITVQFLVETVVLAGTGGVIGVATGFAMGFLVTMTSDIETIFRVWAVVLSFGISVCIGVVFGLYPARRAALLDPIQALRHE